MRWEEQSSAGIDALDRRTPVILNIAATEQHGPHLPLDTDVAIARLFLERLDAQDGGAQVILPPVAVGCSDHHMDFPGTLSVPHFVMHDYVRGILASVAKAGFRNIIVFNSHGGNQGIGQVVLEGFGSENPDCDIVLVTWWSLVRDKLRELSETGPLGTGHACELETSLMMAAGRLDEGAELPPAEYNTYRFKWAAASMLYPAAAAHFQTMKQISGGNGVVGAPASASVEKGERIVEIVVAALRGVVSDMRKSS